MKTLYLVRHAKSSWENFLVKDFDRPLNERGNKAAPQMAKKLLKRNIEIDVFISSNALRAKSTALHFAKAYAKKEKEIILVPQLYLAPPAIFFEVIKTFDNKYNNAAVFAHNPGITDFANQLTTTHINDMPTCAVFALTIHCSNWIDFDTAEKSFLFFDYPKLAG
jgi:phosphohistidine phosphatase